WDLEQSERLIEADAVYFALQADDEAALDRGWLCRQNHARRKKQSKEEGQKRKRESWHQHHRPAFDRVTRPRGSLAQVPRSHLAPSCGTRRDHSLNAIATALVPICFRLATLFGKAKTASRGPTPRRREA